MVRPAQGRVRPARSAALPAGSRPRGPRTRGPGPQDPGRAGLGRQHARGQEARGLEEPHSAGRRWQRRDPPGSCGHPWVPGRRRAAPSRDCYSGDPGLGTQEIRAPPQTTPVCCFPAASRRGQSRESGSPGAAPLGWGRGRPHGHPPTGTIPNPGVISLIYNFISGYRNKC